MEKEMALRLWERLFPGKTEAYDYASHKIRKDDFQKDESEFAWDVDMIKPRSAGGTYQMENLLPASLTTIALRNGRSSFSIGSLFYEVRRGRRYGQFAIYDTTDKVHPLDLTPSDKTQDPFFNETRMNKSLGRHEQKEQESGEKKIDFDTPLRNTLFKADIEKEKTEEEKEIQEEKQEEALPKEETVAESIPLVEEEKAPVAEESAPVESAETAATEVEAPAMEEAPVPQTTTVQEDAFNEERQRLLSEKEESERLLAEEREKQKELEERIRTLEEKERQVEEELKKAQEESLRKDQDIERMKGESEGIRLSLSTREEKIQKLEAELSDWERRSHEQESEKDQESHEKERLSQEKESLLVRIAALETEKSEQEKKVEELNQRLQSLQRELEAKEQEKASLMTAMAEAEEKAKESATAKDSRIQDLEEEKTMLLSQIEEERKRTAEESQEKEKNRQEEGEKKAALLEEQKAENERLLKDKEQLSEEKESLAKEVEQLRGEISQINEKGMANESLLNEKEKALQELTTQLDGQKEKEVGLVSEKESLQKEVETLQSEKDEKEQLCLLLELGGKKECYLEIKERIQDSGNAFDKENVEKILLANPLFLKPSDKHLYPAPEATTETTEEVETTSMPSFSFQDDERERKAYRYYEELIGEGKLDATDFASREIKERHYRREDSPFGWDYAKFDPNAPEEGNVFVANLKTIAEYSPDGRFYANGHEFRVVEKGGRKVFVSQDTIADPFDFADAISVSQANMTKKMPLVYIYVKVCGVSSSIPERKEVSAFFDIVDRTVKRCAPESFLEMQAHNGSNSDYIFLTFDGNKPNAYKEAFDYAILLNSYRVQFKKRGGMDAIVVLDEVDVPFSLRHYSFERLYSETKDVDLNAIRYDLNLTTVINSTIKRTVHIGPEILDKVPIEKARLKTSRLGMGTFSDLFGFGKSYMECNFVFDLSRKADEAEND